MDATYLVARSIVTDIVRAKDNSSVTGMSDSQIKDFTEAIMFLVGKQH